MSRATRIGSALAGLVMATGMLIGAPAAQAENAQVIVGDGVFSPPNVEVVQGEVVVFEMAGDATLRHSVTVPGLFDHEFDPSQPRPQQRFDLPTQNLTPDTYAYGCKFHYQQGMVGQFVVTPASTDTSSSTTTSSSTSTTTTIPASSSTTAPTTPPTSATTTPTTRPATTSTTRPDGTTTAPTTATTATTAKPSVQVASQPTTATTKKKTTPTTAKKKKATPATVKTVRTTTTTTMLPSLAAALPSGAGQEPTPSSADLPDATEAGEEAASWVGKDGGKGGGAKKKMLVALGGLGALSLGGVGWRWYNRSSRYLPA